MFSINPSYYMLIYTNYTIQLPLMTNLFGQNIIQLASNRPAILNLFQSNVFKPKSKKDRGDQEKNDFSDDLMRWAIANEIDHVTFLSFPYNCAMCSKQESLLETDIKYSNQKGVKRHGKLLLDKEYLLKNETDGSSFPSGGLRGTHFARAYTIRDPLSEIFFRKSNKLMYIPSLLVTHNGEALDDKTIFRKTERIMKATATRLLQRLGKNPQDILLNLGLEQEFFVVPKTAYLQRPDLLFTGRTLVGKVGAKHQQFSDHYFGKFPCNIEEIFCEVQQELLTIGIPFKTKHNQVANNQLEFSAIFCEAGKAIDQNLITMEILKQIFDRHGYTVLLHEKPFQEINGSGKHANWSLGYVGGDGKIKNLFAVPKEQEQIQLFQLFILITLAALKRHNALFFASIAPPGNEIRLGGHEAPPRIISASLGDTVNALVDELVLPERKNLKDVLPFLKDDVFQEDTDRNRTSAFPYTGQKFEFRSLGSSQNAAFPMSVICATLAKEMEWVEKKLIGGRSVEEIIAELRQETRAVRFDGNGYSQEWGAQAKKRGLYVNESFAEILSRVDAEAAVFEEIGACSKAEVTARCQVMRESYELTVATEVNTLLSLANQKIIPRAIKYLQVLKDSSLGSSKKGLGSYTENFSETLDRVLSGLEDLRVEKGKSSDYKSACELRKKITAVGEELGELCALLQKDPSFPDLEDFLLL